MRDEEFTVSAAGVLAQVSNEPCELGTSQQIVPRDFLGALAATAAEWPYTPPEVWYGDIMQECFWALVHQHPPEIAGEDERSAAQGMAFGVLLAMSSTDRGGHRAAADLCHTALAYMRTLPAWQDVQIDSDSSGNEIQSDHRFDQARLTGAQTTT